MKFAVAAFGAAAGLGKVLAGAGMAAGKAALGSLTAGGLTAGKLSMASSALQGLAILRDSAARKRQMEAQAQDMRQQALLDRTAGVRQANAALADMLDTMAGQRAAFAASGINPDLGSPQSLTGRTLSQGQSDLALIDNATNARARASQLRAAEYEQAARGALLDGLLEAGGVLAGAGQRAKGRGGPAGTIPPRRRRTGVEQ